MFCIQPGTHGSTYGGNPLSCAVAMASLQVVKGENITKLAEKSGNKFRKGLEPFLKTGIVSETRGKDLLNAIVIEPSKANDRIAWDLCLLMKDNGLLANPIHDTIIRLAPPIVMSEQDICKSLKIITEAVHGLSKCPKSDFH